MPTRKHPNPAGGKKATGAGARPDRVKQLRSVARSTLMAASLAAARLVTEAEAEEPKLFSPGAVDRLQAPISRIHD